MKFRLEHAACVNGIESHGSDLHSSLPILLCPSQRPIQQQEAEGIAYLDSAHHSPHRYHCLVLF